MCCLWVDVCTSAPLDRVGDNPSMLISDGPRLYRRKKQSMKTQARHHGLYGFLLVGLIVIWCTREAGPLEAIMAWGVQLGSWGSCLFMGLYSVAPTLHFRGAAPHVTGQLLCVAILGMAMLTMVTTIGSMVAYLLVRVLIGVWRTFRVTRVIEALSLSATRVRQVKSVDEVRAAH